MTNHIFPLLSDLVVSSDPYRSCTYHAGQCGLSYRFGYIDHIAEMLEFQLVLVDTRLEIVREVLRRTTFCHHGPLDAWHPSTDNYHLITSYIFDGQLNPDGLIWFLNSKLDTTPIWKLVVTKPPFYHVFAEKTQVPQA